MKTIIFELKKPHSVVDLITNSSSETFVIESNKESIEIFNKLIESIHLNGYEVGKIYKGKDYLADRSYYKLPDDVDIDRVFVFDLEYSNAWLNDFVSNFGNPINLIDTEEY